MRPRRPGGPTNRRSAPARSRPAHPTQPGPGRGESQDRDAEPYEDTPGHPMARGTLPMARHLTDPAIEDEIQALAAEAPPMTEDQRAELARLLRLNHKRHTPDAA